MTDLDREFRSLDLLAGPDLTEEIRRRATAPTRALVPPARRRRITAGLVAFAAFAAAAVFAYSVLRPLGKSDEERVTPSPPVVPAEGWSLAQGWSEIPPPPATLVGQVRIWTGSSLVLWGGNEGEGSGRSAEGWRLDEPDGGWSPLAPSPLSPRSFSGAVWTGSEVVIWGGDGGDPVVSVPLADGAAYDPVNDTWRMLPVAPVDGRQPLVSVWTGSEMLVWGAGPNRDANTVLDGGAYDPAADTWSTLPDAPLQINDGHAVWTGSEMIVFGAHLVGGNHAQTDSAIGEAYDPAADTWRELPPSHLSPQASGVAWDGQFMVAADYLSKAQAYDPISDAWGDLLDPPIDVCEDSPLLATSGTRIVEHFCDRTILLDAQGAGWQDVTEPEGQVTSGLTSADGFVVQWPYPSSGAQGSLSGAYTPATGRRGGTGEWTELPLIPEIRDGGSVEVWAGGVLLAAGGSTDASGLPSRHWFSFDPDDASWSPIADAPFARSSFRSVWTGSEALFWGGFDGSRSYTDGMAYNTAAGTWRTLPDAPLETDSPAVAVWTGSEFILWGGGHPGDPSNVRGAAYDPSTDTWRRIPDAPVALKLGGGEWSGHELYVFGSLLDGRNIAQIEGVVGAAYDPAADTWRQIPTAPLSQQASSGAWVDGRLIAYDYVGDAAAYDPLTDRWHRLPDVPIEPGECYPDAIADGDLMLAWYCGQLALFDARTDSWTRVTGGITQAQIAPPAYGGTLYQLWRFASLEEGSGVVFFDAEGISVEEQGMACYGCAGSPRSLWAYRPFPG